VRERFGLARMVEETERVYEEALGLTCFSAGDEI
jgi:hypothetical protein